ncbi:hypothetical protein HYDPIDRAFT_115887, partial [Hydnomerulius pinastri MD-312]
MASKLKKPEKKLKGRWSWCTSRCILHHAPCREFRLCLHSATEFSTNQTKLADTPPEIWA